MGFRIVICNASAFTDLLRGAQFGYFTNAPEDMRVVNIRHDEWARGGQFEILCESDLWEPTPEGQVPAEFHLFFTQTEK